MVPNLIHELPAVDERDRAVLRAFSDDAEATLAFQGIRRSLNLHPEKLSRALRRLEEAGAVSRTKDGYKLTEAGVRAVPVAERARTERLTVLDTMVPATVTAEAVVEHCRAQLAGYKKPRHVVFVDSLPRNSVGKVLKSELRKRGV